MITIFHIPFSRDSKTFASRFLQTMCFTGWLHMSSYISTFSVSTSYIFLNIFQFFHFSNDLWVNNNWNAWLIPSPACYWFGFNKKWGSRRESPPSSFNQGQSWQSSIPRSQVTSCDSHAFDHKVWKEKNWKITRDKFDLAENRENVACMKPFGETDIQEQ